MSEQKSHPYLPESTYDKSYTSIKKSLKLKPGEKALIYHIIGWQERTDEKTGQPLNLKCFQSNKTLSLELGIPLATLERMIGRMNKKYSFFSSTGVPGKGMSKNGGNFNRTFKTIEMEKLTAFLAEEQKELAIQRLIEDDDSNDEQTLSTKPEVQEQAEIKPQLQIPSIPIEDPYKGKVSKEVAFQLLDTIFQTLDLSALFEMNDDEVDIQLRIALDNFPKIPQKEKTIYSAWITDYMREEYPGSKDLYKKYLREEEGSLV